MLGGSQILGCCCLFYLLEPYKARQSQMDLGIVHMDCGATTSTGKQFTRNLSISIQANKAASHGAPLSLSLLSHVLFSHGTLILGPWLLWGLIIQFCRQCWQNLSLCRHTENSAFIFPCHYTTVLSEHATDKTLFFRAGISCCFSCQITRDICWSDHPH